MEKSQRRILYPPVRIDSLITKFDTVGKRKKGELAQEIVRHSTEETFDWLATLKALNTGLSACLSNYKEFGRIIIDGVEQFLDTRGVCFKYLIPPNISSEQAKSQLKHLINDTVTKFQRFAAARPLSSHPHNVEQLIALLRYVEENHQVENEDTQRDIHRTVIDFVANNKALKAIHGEDTYSAAKKPYNLIFKAMGEYEGATEGGKVMKGPETVLTKAQSQVNIKGIPHILTSKFNGVSLEDIANVDLQTTDQLDQLCYMAMKYMAGVPKGDLFWESLISTIFVVPQMSRLDIDAKTFFSNIDFTGRIFLIQQRMAEWLLMPAVSDEITRNEQFDREFAGMISQLSIIQRHNLGGIIRIACLRGPITVCMMDPNVTLERAVHLHSLSNMALQWVEKRDPHTKIVGADKVMHDFLRDSREGISQSWKARFFSAIDVLTNLEEGFELRLDEEYESATGHTNEFIQDMKLWLGEGFIDKLKTRGDELSNVSVDFYVDIRDNKVHYWPEPDTSTEIFFPKGSLAKIMGFDSIVFVVDKDDQYRIEFMIRTKDVNLSVWGDVDTRTGITNFSVNLSEFPGLEILMSSIIGSNFHDLIWQEKIIREIKPRRVAKVQKTDDGVQSPADVANSKISRTLPRAKYVYTGEKTRTMEGYVIKQTIDRDLKRRGIAPCHIDIHKTRLRYSYPYEAAVREYATKYATAIGEEKENLHRILLDTRLKLNKPSETKKNSLPPGFALNTIQDPETRKQFPVETWVIAFWSPKPSDDEQKSPALMYKKYFRGKAAATDYIDQFVLSWIVEEAILEKSPN